MNSHRLACSELCRLAGADRDRGPEFVGAADAVDDVVVAQRPCRHGPGLLGPRRFIGFAAEEDVVGHPDRLAGRELLEREPGQPGRLAAHFPLHPLEVRA